MAEMTHGTALRQLMAAQTGLKKARKTMLAARQAPEKEGLRHVALHEGWAALVRAHRDMAAIPLAATNEDVFTKQLALQRYATSMLVRLRRLARNDPNALDGLDGEDADDAE